MSQKTSWIYYYYYFIFLSQEEVDTKPRLAKTDPREIQKYYQDFYEKNIREGQYTKKP